jgi:ribosomal protein L37E
MGSGTAVFGGANKLLEENMALIKCPECGREVSDKAPVCLGCGAPIAGVVNRQAKVATATPDTLLEFIHPVDGSTYEANIDPQKLMGLNETCKNDREYESWIDNLDGIDSTLRGIFKTLVKFTVTAGKIVFKIGKIILNVVIKLVREFSHTIAGAIAGFVLGSMFSAIPLIGWALGPLVLPLLTFIGAALGFMQDMTRNESNAHESTIRSEVERNFLAMGLKC